jgi:predicted Zn-dependent protease
MEIDADRIAGWIGALARRPEEIADVFIEQRRSLTLDWKDGALGRARVAREAGLAARCRERSGEHLACVSATDETAAREAIRCLQQDLDREPLPVKPRRDDPLEAEAEPPFASERWNRRLATMFARLAPRHRFRWTLAEATRHVIPALGTPAVFTRRLVSLEGTFLAASRQGDETRAFSFHAPDAEATAEELRLALTRAAEPRDAPTSCGDGEMDLVLAGGCAAVLFHEILSHPLEAGADSPLAALEQARVAVPELDVRDDATRLDLFGGYERDDEGMRPQPVKLLDSGRLAGRLTDRAHAARDASNGHGRRAGPWDPPLVRGSNVLVAGGQTTTEEMTRRLHSGLWIMDLDRGSVELASGRFRLRFPRARRVRRGRLADECGPGLVAGEILAALKSIEAGLGRDVRVYRALGWCARDGQVVPVQGAAPDVLLRRLAVHALS